MYPLLSKNISDIDKTFYKNHIIKLQNLLFKLKYPISIDGIFGEQTDFFVKKYQKSIKGLEADGWVGQKTWNSLMNNKINLFENELNLDITDYFLEDDEYYKDIVDKKAVWLHHTAGGGNAYFVTQSWEHDKNKRNKSLKVGTSFIIAKESISRNKNFNCYDGELFRAFNEKYWAHHLGTTHRNNKLLNAASIGIEICSYGYLKLNSKGNFTTMYGNVIDSNEVYDHGKEFRGYRYWHKYSDNQLNTLRKLLLELREKFNLNYQNNFDEKWFDYNPNLFNLSEGIFTHTNVRQDKYDCFPQPELIQVLNSL